MSDEISLYKRPVIRCPYCHRQNDTPERLLIDGEVFDLTCDRCGHIFTVECNLTMLYSTRRKEATEE